MLENSRPQDVKFSETLLHGEEYLKAEYSLLNEWARHGEQATKDLSKNNLAVLI